MTNEELFHKVHIKLAMSNQILFDMNNGKIGINDGIALTYYTCQAALNALQELKNRSEGMEPPKQG